MKVAVVGNGRVGMVVAACLAEMGNDVIGVDLPPTVESLNHGKTRFFEPGLDEKVSKNVKEGRLRGTTWLADVADAQVIWISIGTTQTTDGAIHISTIQQIVTELGQLCSSQAVIAIKSTMPVGACRRMAEKLPADGPVLVSNPEFLRQGSSIYDFYNPGKTVIGSGPQGGTEVLDKVYKQIPGARIYTNWETAETIKITQNAFNALRISFMNELSLSLEGLDISLWHVSEALRVDEPALKRYLNPGFSYGGSCLPSNVAYLSYLARSRGYDAPLLHSIAAVNERRISRLLDKLASTLDGIEGRRIALWGLTYKADTDDLRDSPSVWFVNRLLQAGARVQVLDPYLQAVQVEQLGVGCTYSETAQQSLTSAEALVVLTRCAEFASVARSTITNALQAERVFDLVGALPQLREV